MDEGRILRYKDKLLHIEKRISQINEWMSNVSENQFIEDEKTKLAVYKAFQEAVEASTDIIAMICKDLGIPPKDDYHNILSLRDNNFLSNEISEILIEANGLRNRLIHHYNKLDDKLAYESISMLVEKILEFVEVVYDWIEKELRKLEK